MAGLNDPTISVLLPVYNNEPYLAAAIQSVLDQTFRDFECVIVDDQSTDTSWQTVQRFAAVDPRIRAFRRPHSGLVGTMNHALAECRGEYIARMDGDDVCMPTRFERQLEFLTRHPDHVLVGSRVMLIDPDGDPIGPFALETTHEEIDGAQLAAGWPMVHPAIMVRRNAMVQLGGYRAEFETQEDVDLFLRLAECGRLANIPEVLLLYRQHHRSVCHTQRQLQNERRESVLRATYARRGLQVSKPSKAYHAPSKSRPAVIQCWAWKALSSGYRDTALKHALRLLRLAPHSAETWRLLYCAMRGR